MRELESVIGRATHVASDSLFQPEDLLLELVQSRPREAVASAPGPG
ncbi:hypothetical protein [Pseudomonas sp. dw_358]|nr:hypothetical protein [Pseudomonas sp. dw_358]